MFSTPEREYIPPPAVCCVCFCILRHDFLWSWNIRFATRGTPWDGWLVEKTPAAPNLPYQWSTKRHSEQLPPPWRLLLVRHLRLQPSLIAKLQVLYRSGVWIVVKLFSIGALVHHCRSGCNGASLKGTFESEQRLFCLLSPFFSFLFLHLFGSEEGNKVVWKRRGANSCGFGNWISRPLTLLGAQISWKAFGEVEEAKDRIT